MNDVSLKKLIQNLSRENSTVFIGKVDSVSPLSVSLENGEKTVLDEKNLMIPEHLNDREVQIKMDGVFKQAIICDSVKTGESLYIAMLGEARKYIAIGRVSL